MAAEAGLDENLISADLMVLLTWAEIVTFIVTFTVVTNPSGFEQAV